MVWPFSNNAQPAQQPTGVLNLGLSNGAQSMSAAPAWGMPQQQQNPFMQGMGVPQQPVAPPSELEIFAMLQQTSTPVEAWLMTDGFKQVVGVISSVVALNLVEFFRNAKFVDDGDKGLKIDIASLPAPFQTMSAENVTSELVTLQQAANIAVQNSGARQQQILLAAQQSMMGGALQAAMQNEGFMEQAGGAVGGLARGMFGAATGVR